MTPPRMLNRPPFNVPPPSSAIISKTTATFLPRKGVRSISFNEERILAETRRCSVANRLPPPCEGMPVIVPQAVSDKAKVIQVSLINAVFIVPSLNDGGTIHNILFNVYQKCKLWDKNNNKYLLKIIHYFHCICSLKRILRSIEIQR